MKKVSESKIISDRKQKFIKTQSKNTGDNVHCGLQDRKGNLWFATTAEYEDKKGNIWFGTDKGICRYDGKTFTNIPISMVNTSYIDHFTNKPATNIFVNSILEDKSGTPPDGKFWFGAENGVYCYDGKVFTRF